MSTQVILFTLLVVLIGSTYVGATVTFSAPASLPHSATVDENDEIAGSWKLTLTAQKSGVSAFTWTKVSSNSPGDFELSSGGGMCTAASCDLSILSSAHLDYESGTTSYTVEILAADSALLTDSATATITILVNDINDETPTITTTTLNVNENENPSTLIGTVVATDADSGDTLTYAISGGDASLLHINPSDGKLYSLQKYDYDTGTTSLTTTVTVSDSKATTPNSATVSLTVTINPVNDNAPVCSPSSLYAQIAEDSSTSTSVATVTCTDADTGATIAYAIASGDGSKFTINTSSGMITTAAALDFETTTSYTLQVTGTDGSSTATATVQIEVTDVSDTDPVFTSATTATLAESVAVSTAVLTLEANGTAPIVYTIESVVNAGGAAVASSPFAVGGSTGKIWTTLLLERDVTDGGSYVLTVKAAATASHTVTQNITVTITEVNDNYPIFNPQVYVTSIAEKTAGNTAVLTVTCNDADTTGNTLTYAITSGDDGGALKFSFSGANIMTTNVALDYETKSSYSLVITATDAGSPAKSSTATVQVQVTDVSDTDPVFTSATTATLAESVAVGTAVLTLEANGTAPIVYTIESVVDAGGAAVASSPFTVGGSTGKIWTTLLLERDVTDGGSYVLTVKAAATASHTVTQNITVTITEVNDNYPIFNPQVYVTSIAEKTAGNTAVLTVTCNDADTTGSTLTYAITSGDDGGALKFSFSGANIMTTNVALDYETKSSYSLVITATDAGSPAKSSTATVQVQVTDVSDTDPVFTSATTATLAESVAVGTAVLTLEANGTAPIVYTIESVVDAGGAAVASSPFTVGGSTGKIWTTLLLERDVTDGGSYVLTVKAAATASHTVTQNITVTITEVNDNYPIFNPQVYVTSIAEKTAGNTAVLTVTCNDADTTGNTLTYAITSGDDGGALKFSFSGANIMTTNVALDYETKSSYSLVITATDAGSPAKSSTATVQVQVTDVSDTDPVFTSATTATLTESVAVGTAVLTLEANGTAPIVYTIESVVDAGGAAVASSPFTVGGSTGKIWTTLLLERDVTDGGSYVLTVKAAATASHTVTQNITVTITEVNDNYPIFNPQVYVTSIAEKTAGNTAVLTVTCNDADTTGNTLTYAITSGDDGGALKFSFSGANIMTTNVALDYETKSSYSLVITATDAGSPAKSSTATVQVQVTDVSDTDPVFTSATTATLAESVAVGTAVLTLEANGTAPIVYTIESVVDAGGAAVASSPFTVGGSTGKIWTTLLLERDVADGESLVLTVKAAATASHTVTQNITVTITEVNDNYPIFNPQVYVTSIAENTAGSTAVLTVTCNDADTTGNTLTYAITSGDDGGALKFSFSGANIMTTNAALDYETKSSYSLVITATDAGSPAKSSTATVQVQVIDVGDTAPVFTSGSGSDQGTVTIAEDVAVSTSLYTLTANGTEPIAFSIVNVVDAGNTAQSGFFDVGETTGVIRTKCPFDREATNAAHYVLTVNAVVNGSYTATASLTVSVTDVNDNSPLFNPQVYVVEVAENLASGTEVVTLTATDADVTATSVTFAIISGDDVSPKFSLNVTSGEIVTTNALDYETTPSYTLVATATDDGTPNRTSTATVHVKVKNVADVAPTWTSNGASADQGNYTILEDVACGTAIVTVKASEAVGALVYSVVSTTDAGGSNASGLFTIGSDTGTLRTKALLDRDSSENSTTYVVTVKAVNELGNSVTGTVTVFVTDVNDITPVCNPDQLFAVIDENSAVDTSIANVSCSDGDATGSTVTYEITAGDDVSNKFTLDNSTGELKLSSNSLDYETKLLYDLTVTATDNIGGSTRKTAIATVNVKVTDVNEVTPSWNEDPSSQSLSVAETVSLGTAVYTLNATGSGDMTYSIVGIVDDQMNSVSSAFVVDSASGVIRTGFTPYEADGVNNVTSYTVTARATDSGNPQKSIESNVTIAITDVNEHDPVFASGVHVFSVNENATVGTVVGSLSSVTDGDASTPTFSYLILSGDSQGKFLIDNSTGDVKIAQAIDLDVGGDDPAKYSMQVQVSDGGTTAGPLYGTASLVVAVTPINQHDPGSVSLTATLSEDSAAGTAVALVSVNDTDYGVQGDVTYSIESSNSSKYFVIDSASGQISLRCPIDYEVENNNLPLAITVLAVDGDVDSPRTGTSTVNVTVTDVNDNTPSCTQGYVLLSTAEAAAATTLTTINCTDADISAVHNTLSYSVVVSPDDGNITVVGSELSTAGALDYERVTSYEGYVNITDGTFSATVTFKVEVTPVNEAGPVFSSSSFAVSVSEDATIGTQIATVSATDSDSVQAGHGKLVHTIIEGNSAGHFIIDSDTGDVAVRASLDRETTASYTLTVNAVEEVGTNSANATLTVTVNDTNDNSPVCTQVLQHQILAENSANGTVLSSIALNCSDADEGNNAALTFEIVSGNHNGAFEVSGTGIVVSNSTAVDYESHTLFQLAVNVSDGGGLSEQISAQVSITNVNEHTPVFSSPSYTVSISEGYTLGQAIGANISATDEDRGDTVSFAITGGNNEAKFSMESDGAVTVQKRLDRETTDYFSLEITATDSALSATTTLNVTVLDENDNTPLCNDSPYSVTWLENTTVGTSLVDVNCSDIDIGMNSNITYNISAGNAEGKFAIDEVSGHITLSSSLDFENTKSYALTVTATDQSPTAELTGTAYVGVLVKGVNEHPPVIIEPSGGYIADVSEDASAGLVVLTMNATDADDALTADGVTVWSITSGNTDDAFRLDASSGVLIVNGALDREVTAEYNLTVRASDSGLYVETSAIITITDVNDNCPRFVAANYSAEVMENSTSEVVVLTLSTSDADEGLNANHTFSIVPSQGSTDFYFNDNSIVVNAVLDCENQSVYGLVVKAIDRGMPPQTATTTVVVTVICTNEYDPEFTSGLTTTVSIAEDTAVGVTILNLTATDRDKGCHGEVTFDTASNGDTAFIVQPDTGMFQVAEVLDYDKGPREYNVNVTASDNCCDGSVRSTMVTINVTLTDVNDNCPYFNQTFSASVYENITGGVEVLQVTAYDDDSTVNADLEYFVIGGDADGSFVINITTGVISTSASPALDYETNRTGVLIVRAVDKGTVRLSGTTTVTFNILDSNDNRPFFNHPRMFVSFPEGKTSTSVMKGAGYDADVYMNAKLSFGVFNDSDDHIGVVNLLGNTFQLSIDKAFDREAVTAYTATLNVTDNGEPPLTNLATLHIHIEDVNDNSPVFVTGQDLTASVPEDASSGQHVLTMSATDRDFRENGTVSYAIEASPFGIVATNGHIVVDNPSLLDREKTATHILKVMAKDSGNPPLITTATVTITVTDVNDNNPIISGPITHCIPDPTASGTTLFTPTATDADTGSNARLSWYVSPASGSLFTFFTVNAASGVVKTNGELKGSFGSQLFYLCVKDAGVPVRHDCKTVTVHVRNNCSFSMRYLREYPENTAVDKHLLTIPGSSGATFSFVSSADCKTYLKVGSSSGIISVQKALDRETHGNDIECQVQMTVPGTVITTTGSVDVTIRVTDINDNDPTFSVNIYTASVLCTVNSNVNILRAVATDADDGINAQLTYTVLDLQYQPLFQIDSAGNLRKKATAKVLSCGTTYSFSVRATDGGNPARTSKIVTFKVSTYGPSNVIVFGLTVSVINFNSNLNTFQTRMASLVASLSGNTVVSIGIYQATSTTSASGRRKLLQTTTSFPVQTQVSAYATISNDDGDLTFMTADELTNLLLTPTGDPIPQLYSGDLAAFGIVSVENPYNTTITTTEAPTTPPPETPWLETPTGKAVMTILCLIIAALTATIIVLAIKLTQTSKRLKENVDEGSTESLKPRRTGRDLIAIPSSTRVSPLGKASPDSFEKRSPTPGTTKPGTTVVTPIGAPYDSSAFDPDPNA